MPFITFDHFRRSSVDLGKISSRQKLRYGAIFELDAVAYKLDLLGAEGKERKENLSKSRPTHWLFSIFIEGASRIASIELFITCILKILSTNDN